MMGFDLYYILEGHTPVPCDDCLYWSEWFRSADRRVKADTIAGIFVSTVFLGIDHNYTGEGSPILFETMLFTDTEQDLTFEDLDIGMQRYATWEEAEAGHQAIVEKLKDSLPRLN